MVRVKIVAGMKVRYNQTVEITEEQWKKLKGLSEREMEDELGLYVDLKDICDWDDFEDVELDVVDQEGKPIHPPDYWNPYEQ